MSPTKPASVPRRMWFGMLGAPAAWAAQGLLGWFVAAHGCGQDAAHWLTQSGVRGTEIAITAVALLVALAALLVGLSAWRRGADPHFFSAHARPTPDFLALITILISLAFMLGIAWAGMAAFMLPPCESMR